MSPIDDDLLREFLWSSKEDLQTLEAILLKLEKDSQKEADDIHQAYRLFHSFKGAAGLLQYSELEDAAHKGEELLEQFREKPQDISAENITLLLGFLDAAKETMASIEESGKEKSDVFTKYSSGFQNNGTKSSSPAKEIVAETKSEMEAESTDENKDPEWDELNAFIEQQENERLAAIQAADSDKPKLPLETPGETQEQHIEQESPIPEAPMGTKTYETSEKKNTNTLAVKKTKREKSASSKPADQAVRVNISLLDRLMNLVGELVLTRNQLVQSSSQIVDENLQGIAQTLDQITTDLQDNIMRTRMQPVSSVFNKFPRVVRDLSRQLKKEVRLELSGQETELDRTILESLRDPFTHILRNSLDHGIENPQERAAKQKNPEGCIHIDAFHEGGQVVVEVTDDGNGINTQKVREKAISNGLITEEQAQLMSEAEACMLICNPGLSTAQTVTSVSGRGVGMDVVKSNIEAIGGSLEIRSELGKGSCMRCTIPLTLAIIPALILSYNGRAFGLPQVNLVELVGIETEQAAERVECIRGTEVLRLRDQLLPLIRLNEILQLDKSENESDMFFIAVVAAGDKQFGIIVEEINDVEEIVVKPLSRHLKDIALYAGATIRGDGRVCMILDIPGMLEAANFANIADVTPQSEQESPDYETHSEWEDFLIFHLGHREQFGIPLQAVNRIEQYPSSSLTTINGSWVICHKERLIPLLRLEDVSEVEACAYNAEDPDDMLHVIILSERDGVGLLAKDLVDNIPIDLSSTIHDSSLIRSQHFSALSIINEQPVALLNIFKILDEAFPLEQQEGRVTKESIRPNEGGPKGRILYCEDAEFFQNVIAKYLQSIGHEVDVYANGRLGLEALQAHPDKYNFLLTDIEMPEMNGWQLMRAIRSLPAFDNLPILAISSLGDEEARQTSLEAGAWDHAVKLQKDELLKTINDLLNRAEQNAAGGVEI